jgi:molybdate transport system substrate-binding protein
MGSSGHFTRQIREGLPFDLFCSADSHLIDQLALEGKVTGKAQVMAIGRLALVSRTDLLSVTNEALTSTTLAARLTKSRKLAIANPSHAPYGRAARETLEHMGLWDTVQSQLVQAESAAQATQFALQGAAALALVPVALVPPPDRQMSQWPLKAGALALTVQKIPASYHHPIQQGVGRSVHARAQAQRLQEYLLSPPAQLILREHGFDSVAGT